ncbi:hypothetical protein HYV79_01005 [Candidatus Woesearchaeota archaeon]|nr:hypothetical protein [Candidatus Woesearchaeota archaeon]
MKKGVAIVFVLLILIIGLFFWHYFSAKEYREELSLCEQEVENDKLYSLALETKDENICPNEFCKLEIRHYSVPCEDDYCKAVVEKRPDLCPEKDIWCKARALHNKEGCEELSDNVLKEECLSMVLYDEEYFEAKKVQCQDIVKAKIAFKKLDEKICKKIKNKQILEECIKNIRLISV